MKIAVTGQNRKTVTEHAGACRSGKPGAHSKENQLNYPERGRAVMEQEITRG